jgi:hypothetical protein
MFGGDKLRAYSALYKSMILASSTDELVQALI